MAKRPKRLGRGLNSLIADYRRDDAGAGGEGGAIGPAAEGDAPHTDARRAAQRNGGAEALLPSGGAESDTSLTPHGGTVGGTAHDEGGVVDGQDVVGGAERVETAAVRTAHGDEAGRDAARGGFAGDGVARGPAGSEPLSSGRESSSDAPGRRVSQGVPLRGGAPQSATPGGETERIVADSVAPASRVRAAAEAAGKRGGTYAGSDNSLARAGGEARDGVTGRTERASDTHLAPSHRRGGGVVDARMVALAALRPNRAQPRRELDDEGVRELARSIAVSGLIQPIVAREADGGLEIVAGERRWRAARLAGLSAVPVIVRQASDEEMLALALIENIHREDLNAVDRAAAYDQFCERFGVSAEELAERLGEDRTTVTNYLRLLELPGEVQGMLRRGDLSMGHARSLLGVRDVIRQVELATEVVAKELSVRALETQVRRERRGGGRGLRRERSEAVEGRERPAGYIRDLERRFEEILETKVTIHVEGTRGRGRIVIEFYDVEDFERLGRKMGVLGGGTKGVES